MANNKITINGRQYDSPEAMPPDVRRMYEQAMRTLRPSLAGGQNSGSTQVFTGRAGGLGASVVVNRTVTVNDRTYGSVDELPPEVRKQFEDALKGAAPQVHPQTSLHVSVNMGRPQVRTLDDSGRSPTPHPLPIESSTLESRIRDIPVSLAIIIVIGLILWALLGR
jgi:hypothetical protein